jgi:hypothetical protein
MYTVIVDYIATGEGRTIMVLYTRGFGESEGMENALTRFKSIFGDYFAIGATVYSGMKFDFDNAEMFISKALKESLIKWEKDYWNLEYHFSLHINGA